MYWKIFDFRDTSAEEEKKHAEDAIEIRRRSYPASHLQGGPTNQTK
jgi:hypothetical protein